MGAWSEHIPHGAPGKPEWANLRARSSRQDPCPTATGIAAAPKLFQKYIKRAHFTLEHYQEVTMPLTSFAGESGLIAFAKLSLLKKKNYSHWEYFPQAKLSYNLLTCSFTGRNFIISP